MRENNFESDDHQMEANGNLRLEKCLNSECGLQRDSPLTTPISSFLWIHVAMEQHDSARQDYVFWFGTDRAAGFTKYGKRVETQK